MYFSMNMKNGTQQKILTPKPQKTSLFQKILRLFVKSRIFTPVTVIYIGELNPDGENTLRYYDEDGYEISKKQAEQNVGYKIDIPTTLKITVRQYYTCNSCNLKFTTEDFEIEVPVDLCGHYELPEEIMSFCRDIDCRKMVTKKYKEVVHLTMQT